MDLHLPARSRPRVVMGLLFFPRGGSALVTRSLAQALVEQGWKVTIVCSSLRLPSRLGDAGTFFGDLDIRPVDCTAALSANDPLCADPPLPPSYEDRPAAPDPAQRCRCPRGTRCACGRTPPRDRAAPARDH